MSSRTLPPSLARFSHLPNIKQKTRNEWSAGCPVCGSRGRQTDRFLMWDDGDRSRGYCRKCNHFEWANEQDRSRLSPEEAAEIRRQAEERRLREQAVEEIRRKMLYHKRPWRQWHDQMEKFAVQLWEREGIDEYDQEDYCLGFIYDYKRWDREREREVTKSAFTIPYLINNKNHIRQIQYRLVVPDTLSRYYFEPDIRAPLFLSTPLTLPQGRTLVVEGAKKCIVVNRLLWREFDRVVALPGANYDDGHLEELSLADSVVVMLDPDASEHAKDLADDLQAGGTPARWVQLPEKPDDMIVKYGVGRDEMMRYIRLAR